MGNGNGNGNGFDKLPVVARAIATIGVPGAIAFFMIWIWARDMPHISRVVDQTLIEVQANRRLIEQQNTQTVAAQSATLRLMQRICFNTAKTDIERRGCFE